MSNNSVPQVQVLAANLPYKLILNVGPITINNDGGGVESFNNRTGNVTLTANDVSGALGYAPVDADMLANVAFSGSFSDLVDMPQLVNTFNNRFGNVSLTQSDISNTLGYVPVNGASLADVAFSGSYQDLSNTPTPYSLPAATGTTLGGIKVGANLTVLSDGTLSATGGGSTGVQSFNNRTGEVTLTLPDVQPLTDPIYVPQQNANQTVIASDTGVLLQNGQYNYMLIQDYTTTIAGGGRITTMETPNGQGSNIEAGSGAVLQSVPPVSGYANRSGLKVTFQSVNGTNCGTVTLDNWQNYVWTADSVLSQGYADSRYQPKLANVTTGQSNLTGQSGLYVLGDTLLSSTGLTQRYNGFRGAGTAEPSFNVCGAAQVDSNNTLTGKVELRIGTPTGTNSGLYYSNATTDLGCFTFAFGGRPTMYATDGLGNTTNLRVGATWGACLTTPANLAITSQTVINKQLGDQIYINGNLTYGNATFTSSASATPYNMKLSSVDGYRSLTMGTLDSNRSGYWWNRSYAGSPTSTYPWLLLNTQTPSAPVLQISNNYASDSANGPFYGMGLNFYLDRIERFQSSGNATWTADSIITQGYADTRYAAKPASTFTGTFTTQDGKTVTVSNGIIVSVA